MKIEQKYIRRLPDALKALPGNPKFTPVLRCPKEHFDRLRLAGFTGDLHPGERVVPDVRIGPRATFNATGKFIKHKDLPKEKYSRVIEWTYFQWHGKERVEVTDDTVITRYRYQRTFVPPPSMSLTVAVTETGETIVAAPSIPASEEDRLILAINLLLELAGKCEVLDESGNAILSSPEIRLDWELFPAGKNPWEKVVPALERIISRERPGNRPLIWKRLRAIEGHGPSFRAVGRAGYAGYIVFGFEEKNLFICESTKPDNATYVFAQDWDTFSRLTKAEVIQGNLALERIVHLQDWFRSIDLLFGGEKAA